jgi:hypothetical protein
MGERRTTALRLSFQRPPMACPDCRSITTSATALREPPAVSWKTAPIVVVADLVQVRFNTPPMDGTPVSMAPGAAAGDRRRASNIAGQHSARNAGLGVGSGSGFASQVPALTGDGGREVASGWVRCHPGNLNRLADFKAV